MYRDHMLSSYDKDMIILAHGGGNPDDDTQIQELRMVTVGLNQSKLS